MGLHHIIIIMDEDVASYRKEMKHLLNAISTLFIYPVVTATINMRSYVINFEDNCQIFVQLI